MASTESIRLSLLGLPIIQSLEDFSDLTHISKYTIFQLSKNADKYYKVYSIPKKGGKTRQISQPSKKLKGLQAWILNNILYRLKVSSSCKGFEKKSSTVDNVEPHKYSTAVLSIDLKDFFPSVTRRQVYNVFKSVGYNKRISSILTNVCTFQDSLPQGSPCSPRLANLITWKLDIRIQSFVGRIGLTYTRYADDLTFSGLNPVKLTRIISLIKKIVEDEGFEINTYKTRVAGAARAKKITGLVISNGSFGIGKALANKLRSKIFHLTLPTEQANLQLLNEVDGWFCYLNSVDKRRLSQFRKYIGILCLAHPGTLIKKLN